MDLSKLPKMGASRPADATVPAAPAASEAVTNPAPADTAPVVPIMTGDLVGEAVVAGVLGLIFVMLGWTCGSWLLSTLGGHTYFVPGVTWNDGSPVKFWDLEGAGAWLLFGEWVLGVCLLIEALLAVIGIIRRRFGRVLVTICLLLGVVATLANIAAIAMQVRAGYTQPFMSMIALALGALTLLLHGRRLLT